ncbi:MAG: hypothetical protein ACW99F_11930 [Candidatus Hodarchaeales archaeon]|jgi:hypothetical protein
MKPFIEFILDYHHYTSKSKIHADLMRICPFDHLPKTVTRKDSTCFSLKVYFPETEYLENSYVELERSKTELTQLLLQNDSWLSVKKATIGVLTQSEYEKVLIR